MIRTHVFACSLPRGEADALNRESGRIYTSVLVRHYRVYRKKGHWLSQGAGERLEDSTGLTLLHAHSRDAAQQGFYQACKANILSRHLYGEVGRVMPPPQTMYRYPFVRRGKRSRPDTADLARTEGVATSREAARL